MENLRLSKMFSCLMVLDSSKSHSTENFNKYYSYIVFHLNHRENDKYNSSFGDHLIQWKKLNVIFCE